MWHKAIWKGHPMRLELTLVGLLVELANHYTTRGAPRMELWTGALSWWKCHWPDLKSAGLFRRNLFLKSLKTSKIVFLVDCLSSRNPEHVDHASAAKKGIIWVDLLCLAFLGLGEPACFHWEIFLLVSGS